MSEHCIHSDADMTTGVCRECGMVWIGQDVWVPPSSVQRLTPTPQPAEAVAALLRDVRSVVRRELAWAGMNEDERTARADIISNEVERLLTRDHARCETLRAAVPEMPWTLSTSISAWVCYACKAERYQRDLTPDDDRGGHHRGCAWVAALAPTVAASDVSCIHLPGHPDDCEECDCTPSPATEAEHRG